MENEIFLTEFLHDKQDNNNQIEKILLLQRLIRSYYVRRQFEQVRKEYLKTLSDIEGEILIKPIEIIPVKPNEVISIKPIETIPVKSNEISPIKPEQLQQTVVILPTKNELLKKREEIAMELLWIEQAIQSRKDYLRLKSRYTTSVS